MPYRGPKRTVQLNEIRALETALDSVPDDLRRLRRLMEERGVEEVDNVRVPTDIVTKAKSLLECARTLRNAWFSKFTDRECDDANSDPNAAAILPIGLASLKPNTTLKRSLWGGGCGVLVLWLGLATSSVVEVNRDDQYITHERRSPVQRMLGMPGSERIVSDTQTGRVLHRGPLQRGVAHGEWSVWQQHDRRFERLTFVEGNPVDLEFVASRLSDPYKFASANP